MRITKWGEYGILVSLYLAHRGCVESDNGAPSVPSSIGASEIAEAHSLPLHYTQQILHRLRKGGVVASIRGPGGGYRLARQPLEISLKDILHASEGDTFEVICEAGSVDCNTISASHGCTQFCGLRSVWIELKDAIDGLLAEKTLAGILAQRDRDDEARAKSAAGPETCGSSECSRDELN